MPTSQHKPAEKYNLGSLGPVNRMGYGAMQLAGPGAWGPTRDRAEALRVLRRAIDLGVEHIDTAHLYGPAVSNELIKEALAPYPEQLRLATKVGNGRAGDGSWTPALSPSELRSDVDDNLRSLGVERLDLVNLRLIEGSDVPFEESLGALIELHAEGKIDAIGLSNAGVAELNQAQALTEIACVQNQYNVLEPDSESVLEACATRGVAFVPFFPLGSAFTGGPARLASEPMLRDVAARHDATPSQVALAWLLHIGDHILLIPGTSSVAHLEENVAAGSLQLAPSDVAALNELSRAHAGTAEANA